MRHRIQAIRVDHRDLHQDHIVANLADLIALIGQHAISQFRRMLRRCDLAGVKPGVNPNNGLPFPGQSLSLFGSRLAQRQAAVDLLEAIQLTQVFRRRDVGHQHRPAVRALAELLQLDAVAGLRQLLEVATDGFEVSDLVIGARLVAQMLLRRGHGRGY